MFTASPPSTRRNRKAFDSISKTVRDAKARVQRDVPNATDIVARRTNGPGSQIVVEWRQ